jgi:predicted nucleotidyltransferase
MEGMAEMKICGIVAEYNPFHQGHSYHIRQTREITGCDAVVAVMSGNFVQRGEPAMFDKWARTRMALLGGVDAVFEIPAFYVLQSADWFACGGISVLDGLRLDYLTFGAEEADLGRLRALGELRDKEPPELQAAIRQGLESGLPHPKARAAALEAHFGGSTAAALDQPNSVLGSMYLYWLNRLGSVMEPVAVQRFGAGYNDSGITGTIASATAVRRSIECGDGSWRQAVPEAVAAAINTELEQGRVLNAAALDAMLLYALRTGADLPDTAEGLDRRMRDAAYQSGTAEELYHTAKCKRYTMARIKRCAMQAMLGITANDVELLRTSRPAYARLLGYSRRVPGLINELAARATIPLIARPAEYQPQSGEQARLWQIDLQSSDTYALMMKNPAMRQGKRDYTERMVAL